MPKKLRRIFFSGAGGVGKTSVVEPVLAGLRGAGYKAEFMPSVSREFFKASNIPTELAGLERPEGDRLDFQLALFEFYCKTAQATCQRMKDEGVEYLLLDRSPFDHIAYAIYSAPNIVLTDTLHKMFARGREVILHPTKNLGRDMDWKIVRFPVLASWLNKKVVDDGMRHAPPGKNYMIDALIDSNIRYSMAGITLNDFIVRLTADSTIEMRTRVVLENLE